MNTERREVWMQRVQRLADSGLTTREFAREIGVNPHTFAGWKWRLSRQSEESSPSGASKPRFVDVTAEVRRAAQTRADALQAADGHAPYEVMLASGSPHPRSVCVRAGLVATACLDAGGALMLPTGVRILVCTEPQDMRRSFDTLALVARKKVGEDPQSVALYVFLGKRASRLKILWWDRKGFCLLSKRLHRSVFITPHGAAGGNSAVKIHSSALAQLLAGVPQEP